MLYFQTMFDVGFCHDDYALILDVFEGVCFTTRPQKSL